MRVDSGSFRLMSKPPENTERRVNQTRSFWRGIGAQRFRRSAFGWCSAHELEGVGAFFPSRPDRPEQQVSQGNRIILNSLNISHIESIQIQPNGANAQMRLLIPQELMMTYPMLLLGGMRLAG